MQKLLDEWAAAWGIPEHAFNDLIQRLALITPQPQRKSNSERAIANHARIAFTRDEGGILWRNNVGAVTDSQGNFFRYGLANDTPEMNRICKSADLIGIRPVKITEEMVGSEIGQFVSREVKAAGWEPGKDKKREKAQATWAKIINTMGGDARFVTGEEKQ